MDFIGGMQMSKVSEHFIRSEFRCKGTNCDGAGNNCGFEAVDFELLMALEDVRNHFKSPVKINSACRCEKHNKEVGGSENSMHKKGMACDIVVVGVHPSEVQAYLMNKYKGSKGIGVYDNFTHFDVRDIEARWRL